MRRLRQTYDILSAPRAPSRDGRPGYRRFFSSTASWMILAGYLAIFITFFDDPKLRLSPNILLCLSVGLLAAGYALTALLCYASSDWHFRSHKVFAPALGSCLAGLLSILYLYAVSHRLVWQTASIVTCAVAGASSLIYTLLLLYAYRKLRSPKEQRYSNISNTQNWLNDHNAANNGMAHYPSDQTIFSLNQWPPQGAAFDEVHDPTVSNFRALLSTAPPDRGRSPSADAMSTYHIDLPEDREEREQEREHLSLPRSVLGYYNPAQNRSGRSRKGSEAVVSGSGSPGSAQTLRTDFSSADRTPSSSSGLGTRVIQTDNSRGRSGGDIHRDPRRLKSTTAAAAAAADALTTNLQAQRGHGHSAGSQRSRSTASILDERWRDREERRREIENPYTGSAVAAAAKQEQGESREHRRREIELGFR